MLDIRNLKPNLEKLNPSSPKYDPLYEEIYELYSELTAETAQRLARNLDDKNFYLGDPSEHWFTPEELSDIHPIINYGAVIINKFADLLTAGDMPGIQILSPSNDDQIKAFAAAAENLLYRILDVNQAKRELHYAAVNGSMLGDSFFHLYWDPDKMVGGKKGSPVIKSVSPFFLRVKYSTTNWDNIESWQMQYRMTPRLIKKKFGIEVMPSNTSTVPGAVGSTTSAPFDGTPVESDKTYVPMDTVIEHHDPEKEAYLIGDQAILVKENKGHHGLFHIRNRTAPNEPWGYPDHYMIKDSNRLLNRLHGKAQEIIDTHAAPIIIDKGNVMGGKRIKTRHNTVVTTAPWMQGEGLEYLQWNGNIFPIEQLIQTTTQTIHDLGEMPEAAFGSQQTGVTSGYGLSLQMQPTLMRVKIKQNAEWGPNLVEMFHYLLKLAIENDKSLGLPKEVADFEIRIKWPSPLPRDDAREIQNQVALTTNKLTSRETAMQNLLVEDVIEERKKIDNEAIHDAEQQASAQKILGEVQLEMAQEQQAAQQAAQQGQGETANGNPIQAGQAPEQAFPEFPEEQRQTPQSTGADNGESIAPTSTGGG